MQVINNIRMDLREEPIDEKLSQKAQLATEWIAICDMDNNVTHLYPNVCADELPELEYPSYKVKTQHPLHRMKGRVRIYNESFYSFTNAYTEFYI